MRTSRTDGRPVDIIPALLPKSREEFAALAARVEPFAKTVQLDVVDGVFNDNASWPYTAPGIAEDISGFRLPALEKIFWEVDLMAQEPREIGLSFIRAGASRVIAHVEAFQDADAARGVLEAWQQAGAQALIALSLDTPIARIEELFYDAQGVQVMGIAEIGAQGRPFDERALARVRELRARFPEALISVDGGVTVERAAELRRAGADRLVVGSAIMKANDPQAAYEEIVRAISSV